MLRAHGRHSEEAHLNREAPVSVQKKHKGLRRVHFFRLSRLTHNSALCCVDCLSACEDTDAFLNTSVSQLDVRALGKESGMMAASKFWPLLCSLVLAWRANL